MGKAISWGWRRKLGEEQGASSPRLSAERAERLSAHSLPGKPTWGGRTGTACPTVHLPGHRPSPRDPSSPGPLSQDLGTLTGTGLPVTAEHVALGALTGKGSVGADAGVLAAVVAQQAVVSPWEPQTVGVSGPGWAVPRGHGSPEQRAEERCCPPKPPASPHTFHSPCKPRLSGSRTHASRS